MARRVARWASIAVIAVFIGARLAPGGGSPEAEGELEAALADGRLDPQVGASVARGEPITAIVVFSQIPLRERDLRRAAQGQDAIVETYPGLGIARIRYAQPARLARALRQPAVKAVREDALQQAAIVESLPLVNQPAAQAAGFTGEGTTVAVVDTGADCARLTAPGGTCPVVWAQDFADDDQNQDDDGHGTNVSGIVAGVAPGVRIAALDVFKKDAAGNNLTADSDVLRALQAVLTRRAELNIVAVNLSLGNSLIRNITRCVLSPYENAFASLRSNGILPVVAAGNSSYSTGLFFNGVAAPACAPGALVVGAVYDSDFGRVAWPQQDPFFRSPIWPQSPCTDATTGPDRVTCFSQSASFLGVLAPGALITAGGLRMAGTSQATPHVAGAVAVLAKANPGSTAAEREAAIVNSGEPVFDSRNGVTKRRLELCGALSAVGAACGGASLALSRQAVPQGAWRYYTVDVAPGTDLITIALRGGSADLDLFTRPGAKPTQTENDCRRDGATGDETCIHLNPAPGRWWVGVYGYAAGSFSVTLTTAELPPLSTRAVLPGVAREQPGSRK